MTKVKRKKYVCLRQDGETFVVWAESPKEAREACIVWTPWKILRLPGSLQVDWMEQTLPASAGGVLHESVASGARVSE